MSINKKMENFTGKQIFEIQLFNTLILNLNPSTGSHSTSSVRAGRRQIPILHSQISNLESQILMIFPSAMANTSSFARGLIAWVPVKRLKAGRVQFVCEKWKQGNLADCLRPVGKIMAG